jgi:hypothetical protein
MRSTPRFALLDFAFAAKVERLGAAAPRGTQFKDLSEARYV